MIDARALVIAKAPVPGYAKTRLAASVGRIAAAEVAAAALLDTLTACRRAFGAGNCFLALTGDLSQAVRGPDIHAALRDWIVIAQRGQDFAERLANAHLDVPAGGPVVQVGMDTPQVTAADLREVAGAMESHDAVLGPAEDGGWWALGLRRPEGAKALRGVPMSTPTTYADTRAALIAAGLQVGAVLTLRDVDTEADAHAVAAAAADGEFGQAWAGLVRR